jgi:hypothetical protein
MKNHVFSITYYFVRENFYINFAINNYIKNTHTAMIEGLDNRTRIRY